MMQTKQTFRSHWILGVAAMLVIATAGCGKKPVPPAPPAPPPPPAPAALPTVTLQANPNSVERGSQTTLRWTSQNAVQVQLNGAAVNLNGNQSVSPTASTDYRVVATNADGKTADATVHISVTEPPPPPPPPPPPVEKPIDMNTLFAENVRDAFFDYDKAQIRPDAQAILVSDAQFLKAHPEWDFVIEGHCDDRGSAEYNLALGDRRANAVRDFMTQQGVDQSRIRTVSYGKEKPFCTQDTDDCWQQNRRGHLALPQ